MDDAYIPMTYARNLVEGHGIVFYPGGERVEGFTSPLWMFVLSIFAFVKLSLPAAAFYGGILFGAGTIILTSLIYRRVFQDQNQSALLPSLWAALAGILLVADASFPAWSSSGMDTAIYSFCLLLMIYALADSGSPPDLSVPADALPDPSRSCVCHTSFSLLYHIRVPLPTGGEISSALFHPAIRFIPALPFSISAPFCKYLLRQA